MPQKPPPDTDLADVLRAVRESFDLVGAEFRRRLGDLSEDTQYRLDKEFGRQMAKHPELYAELKRAYRRVRRAADDAASRFGLK